MTTTTEITDKDRMDALERQSWGIRNDGTGSYIYVGTIFLKGKPWGVAKTVRGAIDDAIRACGLDPKATEKPELTEAPNCPEAGT